MSAKSFLNRTDAEIMEAIGKRLRAARGRMRQAEAAERAGLTRQTVSRAEQGDNPTLATIVRLLRVYGLLGVLESFLSEAQVSPMALLRDAQKGGGGTRG